LALITDQQVVFGVAANTTTTTAAVAASFCVHRNKKSIESSKKKDINILQVASKTASKHQKTVSLLGW